MKTPSTPMRSHQLELEGCTISYQIQRSKRRKRTISIKVQHDQVKVLVPHYTSNTEIQTLVHKRARWILAQQAKFAEHRAQRPAARSFVSGERFHYLGQPYQLMLVPGLGQTGLSEDKLLTAAATAEQVRESLIVWYYQQAAYVLPQRAASYCAQMGLEVPSILVRNQKKRWGSCNSRGEVRLNWRLMLLPLPQLDYVLVHELVHLEHMNHSKVFWQRVAEVLPDFKEREKGLKEWAYVFEVYP